MATKSKLTLLVDGNWLLMSRLAVLKNKYQDDDELNKQLKLMMVRSINVVLRTFTDIDNIIFVADGGSWRNTVSIPSNLIRKRERGEIISEEYKGTRKQDDDINRDKLFESYESFIDTLSRNNITTCRIKGLEGDDWIYHWSHYLNNIGTNVIIWSADKDLTQLVKTDSTTNCFTVWWELNTGVKIASTNINDDDNFLFNQIYDYNHNIMMNIINKSKNVTKVDAKSIVIDKIIKGDGSDNIQPIMIRHAKNPTSTKKYKISSSDIDYTLDYNDDNKVLNYLTSLYYSKSYCDRVEDSLDEVFEHFKYNRKLVSLDINEMPDEIKEIMSEHERLDHISKDISVVQSTIEAQSNELQSILEIL